MKQLSKHANHLDWLAPARKKFNTKKQQFKVLSEFQSGTFQRLGFGVLNLEGKVGQNTASQLVSTQKNHTLRHDRSAKSLVLCIWGTYLQPDMDDKSS